MEPSTEVREAYLQLLKAFSGGDPAAFVACFSQQPGSVLIGTASEEWFAGPAAIKELAEGMLPVLKRAGVTFEPSDPQAFREGSVGWVADRITLRAASGKAQEVRATVVVRQEDGRWKAVQYDHSIGVPDDQVELFREVLGA
jgi:ketosteroid isomerase-like protein